MTGPTAEIPADMAAIAVRGGKGPPEALVQTRVPTPAPDRRQRA